MQIKDTDLFYYFLVSIKDTTFFSNLSFFVVAIAGT